MHYLETSPFPLGKVLPTSLRQPKPAEVRMALQTGHRLNSTEGAAQELAKRSPIQGTPYSTAHCYGVSQRQPAGQLCSNARTIHWEFASKMRPEHPFTAALSFLVPQILPLPTTSLVALPVQHQTFSVAWLGRKGWRCFSLLFSFQTAFSLHGRILQKKKLMLHMEDQGTPRTA